MSIYLPIGKDNVAPLTTWTNGTTVKNLAAFALCMALSHAACAGAWGTGSFENDDALDWISACTGSQGKTAIAATLEAALSADVVEAPDGAMAVAAAEVVAAAHGKGSANLPRALSAWLAHQPRTQIAGLAPLARKALARIGQPASSELAQLWSGKNDGKWKEQMAELAARLR